MWHRHNNLRKAYMIKWNNLWRRYYLEQGRILLNNMNTPSVVFPVEEVERIFVKMYTDTGTAFADNNFDHLTKASDKFNLTWEELMANYARTEGGYSIVSISNTAKDRAQLIIQEATATAIEEGWSHAQLSKVIETKVWDSWKITSKFNSARIARTEVLTAASEGAHLAAKTSGLPLKKVWISDTNVARARPNHLALNGTTIGIDERFEVGDSMMLFPGDKAGSAGEVVNCLCAIGYTTGLF